VSKLFKWSCTEPVQPHKCCSLFFFLCRELDNSAHFVSIILFEGNSMTHCNHYRVTNMLDAPSTVFSHQQSMFGSIPAMCVPHLCY